MACEGHPPLSHAGFESVLWCFQHVDSLLKEQKDCMKELFLGRDIFATLPTGFGKSVIFRLFPRLINTSQRNAVSTIIVVTPLVAIIKD